MLHWQQPVNRAKELSLCVFEASMFQGAPFMYWCVSAVAMLLVSVVIKANDTETFVAMYPRRDRSLGIWSLCNAAWFFEGIYLPSCFCYAAYTLFASRPDSMQVI